MDGGDDGNLVIKKRFVTEAELDERRKRRQEEWEKVRKPEDPEGIWAYSWPFNITVLILTTSLQRRYPCPHFRGEELRLRGVKEPVSGLHSGKQSQLNHALAPFTLPHCLPGDSTSPFYLDRWVQDPNN